MDVSSQVDFLIGQVADAKRLWSQNWKQVYQDREIYAQHLLKCIIGELSKLLFEKLSAGYGKSFDELAKKARASIDVWSEDPDNITIRSKSHILVSSLTVAAAEVNNLMTKDVEAIAGKFREILINWENKDQHHKTNPSAEVITTFAGEQAFNYGMGFEEYARYAITSGYDITETIQRWNSDPWNLKYEFLYPNQQAYDKAEGVRQELAKAKNLKGLTIKEAHNSWNFSEVPESVIQSFAGILEDHPSLQTLILDTEKDTFDAKGVQILAEGISKLKNLSEFGCQSTSFKEDPFAALDKLTNILQNHPLKRLKFTFYEFQNSGAILKKFKDLRSLIVEFTKGSFSGYGGPGPGYGRPGPGYGGPGPGYGGPSDEILILSPNLNKLDLTFPESAISQVLKASPNLNKLDLTFERPDDKESLKQLIESISNLKNLRMLSLVISGSCTPDETIIDFWKVIQHLPLEGVRLKYQNTQEESSPGSRDKIAQTIVEALKKMKRLQYLTFDPRNIWESLQKIHKLEDPELTDLDGYPTN